MKKFRYINKISGLLLTVLFFTGCGLFDDENGEEDGGERHGNVLVRVNWEDRSDKRIMRMSLFSQNHHPHLDCETIDDTGLRYVTLPIESNYKPVIYDYNAKNIYFRNETVCEQAEAYTFPATRATYRARVRNALPPETGDEPTVLEPDTFHHQAWDETFLMEWMPDVDGEAVIDFHPVDVIREFTFRINYIRGANNISHVRGAVSGMSATMFLATGAMSSTRSTVMFENTTASDEEMGTITGYFRTFGPVEDESGYRNLLSIELMSGGMHFINYWDVSEQIAESMADRDAKLARDGYDILIENDLNADFPPFPSGDGSGGFGPMEEWEDVVL